MSQVGQCLSKSIGIDNISQQARIKTTVDLNGSACYVSGLLRGEEGDQVTHVFRFA